METFEGHRALFRPLVRPAVAIGNFDGVHLGHQALLASARTAADRLGGDAVVFTFDPHPQAVLSPERAPLLLTPRPRKLELLAAAGIDVCILEPFTPEIAAMDPEAFVNEILVETVGAGHVVVGYDFNYGKARAGNAETLRAHGVRAGFTVEVVDAVTIGDQPVSSSAIRTALSTGDMERAHTLLDRNFSVDGTVVRGAGRGRTIGIPTANLETGAVVLPAPGVYAAYVRVLDQVAPVAHLAAVNLGTNPTFAGQTLSLEAHLLDYSADLYGAVLRIEFVARLRGEVKFSGPAELVAQIHRDIANVRGILGSHPA